MMEKRVIPFSPPDISELEINEVAEALRSGWITTGPRTKELEKRLAEYCHTSKVVCLNSATAAEELNFRIAGIGEGDEVIVPAYTYTASASAAIHCGAKVVFVDSQKDCVEMDYEKVATLKSWYGRQRKDVKERRQAMLDFFNPMRRAILEHKPNEGHRIIAALENDFDVTVITQNGDDYHTRAGST